MEHRIDGKDVMVCYALLFRCWCDERDDHSKYFSNKTVVQQISEWILLIFAYLFVAARIYTRVIRLRSKLNWSDWLLIVSALDALGLIICDTLTYRMGVLDEYETSERLSKVRFLFHDHYALWDTNAYTR
jgi:hypothetical protein